MTRSPFAEWTVKTTRRQALFQAAFHHAGPTPFLLPKHEVEVELCESADRLKPEEAALLGLLSRRIGKDKKAGRVA